MRNNLLGETLTIRALVFVADQQFVIKLNILQEAFLLQVRFSGPAQEMFRV